MNKLTLAVPIGPTFFGTSLGSLQNPTGIGSLVSLFLKISFVLAGLILLFYFILGGISMISSAGKSDPKAAEQAKATITSAVIGFVVVFTAYWIVELIGKLFGITGIL
jgi:hypothetical protein